MPFNFVSYYENNRIGTDVEFLDFQYQFLKNIDKEFKEGYIKEFTKTESSVNFRGTPFRFAWNGWNVFNTITSGTISLDHSNDQIFIKFKLFFWEMMVLCSIFSIIPLVGIFPSISLRVFSFILIWAIYCTIVVISAARFKTFISRQIIIINKNKKSKKS